MLKLVDFLWCSMKMRNINKLLLTKVCAQNLDTYTTYALSGRGNF